MTFYPVTFSDCRSISAALGWAEWDTAHLQLVGKIIRRRHELTPPEGKHPGAHQLHEAGETGFISVSRELSSNDKQFAESWRIRNFPNSP